MLVDVAAMTRIEKGPPGGGPFVFDDALRVCGHNSDTTTLNIHPRHGVCKRRLVARPTPDGLLNFTAWRSREQAHSGQMYARRPDHGIGESVEKGGIKR